MDTRLNLIPPTDEQIRRLAHKLWVERGCPSDSAEKDWFAAQHQLCCEQALRLAFEHRAQNKADLEAPSQPQRMMPSVSP